jgi:acyl-CoA thioesterase FadM
MITFTCRMMGEILIGAVYRFRVGAPLSATFRLWPIDTDIYMHMNNAQYLRIAELSRWRQFSQGGMLVPCLQHGWMFLIAEQTVRYIKPITPFQKYVVRSEITVNGKWIHYEHFFQSNENSDSTLFAHIKMRAVIKRPSGQTVLPEELLERCPDVRKWIVPSVTKN